MIFAQRWSPTPKLMDPRLAAAIPLDLADIRRTLDGMVPAQAKVSRKRWANLRSDLAAAFDASGLRPMLRTAGVELAGDWIRLFQPVTDLRVRNGLSRFARWASLRRITPEAVDDAVIERFVAELQAASLIRNIHAQHRSVDRPGISCVLCNPPQPHRRRGAGEQAGADTSAVGAASSLLPSRYRPVPRLVRHARPARRASAGQSPCTADARLRRDQIDRP